MMLSNSSRRARNSAFWPIVSLMALSIASSWLVKCSIVAAANLSAMLSLERDDFRLAPRYTTVGLVGAARFRLSGGFFAKRITPMQSPIRAALEATLSGTFLLSKSRIETLACLLIAMVSGRTVNLTHAACHLPGEALHASRYRRLQRFFQHVRLDQDALVRLVIGMLNLHRPIPLALDRTNWRIGSKDINILVLAVVTRRFRVPLMWTLLTHQGNSDTEQRIALMERYLALFGAGSIQKVSACRSR
jgi:hypothetical protein